MASFVKSVQEAFAPMFRPAGTLIEGVNPSSWASPNNPIRPTAQLATGVRTWDFRPGINLNFTPRGDSPITFQQLNNVANSFDLCRLIIERRKNQVVNRPWVIRVKTQPGELKAQRLKREGTTPNVARVSKLLRFPDGYHPFDKWIRMWLEDLLVYDAPVISPVQNMLGDVMALRTISGTTITPLVDQQGFVPMPPSPAFQQIILGIPTSNMIAAGWQKTKDGKGSEKGFAADALFYSPMNPRNNSRWGFGPIEQMVTTLAIAANRQTFFRSYYTSGNVPEGLLSVPETWDTKQIKEFQNWFDSILAGNLQRKRRILIVPDTKKGIQFSKTEALTDTTDEYLIRVVAFAFGISPSNLVKQVGHQSTNKEQTDTSQEEGLEPILKHIEVELNRVIELGLGAEDVEFAFADAREVDPLKKSQVDVAYINSGTYTRDEIREANGDDPLGVPQGAIPGITTATGFVPLDAPVADPNADPEDDGTPPKGQQPQSGAARNKVRKAAALKIVAGDLTPRSTQARQAMDRKLGQFLKNQGMRVAKAARGEYIAQKAVGGGKLAKGDAEDDRNKALVILAMLQWQYPDLYAAVLPYMEEAAGQGAETGAYQMAAHQGANLNDVLEVSLGKAKAAAADRAAELVGLKKDDTGALVEDPAAQWAMSTTAKANVLETIKQAIREDWSPADLEAGIQQLDLFSEDHAAMIADNEITRQQASGHLQSWLSSGKVLEYTWTVADLGCCPLCFSFSMLGSVPVGYEFAPMIWAPGAHPFCRCWLTASKFKPTEED
jgi:HK97 family phage portal protein